MEIHVKEFIEELNLDPVAANTFIGHIDRVPFRMEMVANAQTIGLLFHTRFSNLLQPIPEYPKTPSGGILESVIADKKGDLTADQSQVWFNLFAAQELIESNTIIPALKEFAASIKPYVDFDQQSCFLCKIETETQPIYHSEKLHLICNSCHARLHEKAQQLSRIDPANFILGTLWGGLAAIAGGVIWCVGWIVYNWIFADVRVPMILFTISTVAISVAVAFPMAAVFKRIPRRGVKVANLMTIGACLLAVVFGESFFNTYLVVKALGSIPTLSGIVRVESLLLDELGSFYWILKFVTVIILCGICLTWSAPKIDLEEHVSKPK
jgi:hypothetical protein